MYFDKSSIKCWQFKNRNKKFLCCATVSHCHTVTLNAWYLNWKCEWDCQHQFNCESSKWRKDLKSLFTSRHVRSCACFGASFSRRSLKSSFCQRLRLAHIEGPLITAPADTPPVPSSSLPRCDQVSSDTPVQWGLRSGHLKEHLSITNHSSRFR